MNRSPDTGGLTAVPTVTVTLTDPTVPAGAVADTEVLEFTVNEVPGLFPKCTAVAPLSPSPVMVTLVPPALDPVAGEIELAEGP